MYCLMTLRLCEVSTPRQAHERENWGAPSSERLKPYAMMQVFALDRMFLQSAASLRPNHPTNGPRMQSYN